MIREEVPGKDENFQPLIDESTVKKLLARERKLPATQESLSKITENRDSWSKYKKQLVSGLVWDVRYRKFTGGSSPAGNTFSKYLHAKHVHTFIRRNMHACGHACRKWVCIWCERARET
jgi:hypothetical protein